MVGDLGLTDATRGIDILVGIVFANDKALAFATDFLMLGFAALEALSTAIRISMASLASLSIELVPFASKASRGYGGQHGQQNGSDQQALSPKTVKLPPRG